MNYKRVVAYFAVHYGREWLGWAVNAVQSMVDEVIIYYTSQPSYAGVVRTPCPESENDLKSSIKDWFNVTWYSHDRFNGEGVLRDHVVDLCVNKHRADIVLPVDADEVWEPRVLESALKWSIDNQQTRDLRTGMQHFWRSVNWVCRDEAMPVRLLRPDLPAGDSYLPREFGIPIHHFGYAQSAAIVKYKWLIHGHLNEMRPGWFENKFLPWKPVMLDVHPTSVDYWQPAAFDKREIHHLIGDHPYYNLELIP